MSTKSICVYMYLQSTAILSHTVYIMYTHTYGSIHISAHTYTHTHNDRKDWTTRPIYKRAWHSGHSLEYVTWSSSLGRKANAHQTSLSNPSKGKETSRRRMVLGDGGVPSPLTSGTLAKINSHNLVLIRHSSIAGARN